MKALVVYDSVFGNTKKVAEAMGAALAELAQTQTLRVTEVKKEYLADLDVLIVGSPTRGFTYTPDTKKFLRRIPSGGLKGCAVAGFDTRFPQKNIDDVGILKFLVSIFGFAAEPIAKILVKKGGKEAINPEGFFVSDSEGPLLENEQERAAEWAKGVVGG